MTHRRLRRELQLLKLWGGISSLLLVVATAAAFKQAAIPAHNLGEITVERINVVDKNGTLRLVIADKDRMHPGQMDGKVIDRPRPVAGLIFFNDEGDEVGGLTYSGEEKNGARKAETVLMFDQLKQDQTIGFDYGEHNGRREAGFHVWDRPDEHLTTLIDKLNAANRIADPAARTAAVAQAEATSPKGHQRLFAGKQPDGSATVSLADADGRPRLRLGVQPDGAAAIEFLDESGKITSRLPR